MIVKYEVNIPDASSADTDQQELPYNVCEYW